jgi:hypothetical protein
MRRIQCLVSLLSVTFATFSFANIPLDDFELLLSKNKTDSLAEKIKQHPPEIEAKLQSIPPEDIQTAASLESTAKANITTELAKHFQSADTD